jgi:nitrile hydratase accessory protein
MFEERVGFDEPWQAQAWVIARALERSGLFSPAEWSEALGASIRARGDDQYYEAVLETLETLIKRKGAASSVELARMKQAWEEAYETTPHGKPVNLAEGERDWVKR